MKIFQTRSLCYVSDTVEYLFRLMNSDFKGVMNIGNPDEIQIIDLAKKIIQKTDSGSKIKFLDLPQDDPEHRKPDISLSIEKLGYEPLVSLEDGLGILIKWVQERLKSS